MTNKKGLNLGSFYPALFFIFLIALFFNEVFFSGKVFIARAADCYYSHYSWAAYFRNALSCGILPLWNPLSFCGSPYGANSTSNVCILNILVYIFKDLNLAWNIRILSNVFLSALFTFLYVRRLGFSRFAGLISGIIYALCPFDTSSFTINFVESYSFFLPMFLFLIELFYSSRRPIYIIMTGLSFMIFILSSNPQFTLYVAIFFILYVLFKFRSGLALFIVLFSAGSASFYTFRLLESFHISQRPDLWFSNVLLPPHLINMIFPFLFESPFRPETNFFFAHLFNEMTRAFFHTDKILYIFPPYVGVMGITLFLFSLREKGIAGFYKAIILAVFVYLMTYPLLFSLYRHIPFIGKMPNVERIGIFITFSLAVLAGVGGDFVSRQKINLKPLASFYALISCVILGAFSVIRIIVRAKGEAIRYFFVNYINNHVIGSAQHSQSPDFYLKRVDEFFAFINQWTYLLSPSVVLPIIFISVVLLTLYLWQKKYINKSLFSVLCIFLLTADIFIFFKASSREMAKPEELETSSKVIDFLKSDKELFRVMPVIDEDSYNSPNLGVSQRSFLAPEANIIYNLASVEGYDSFFLKRYRDFFMIFSKNFSLSYPGTAGGRESDFDFKIADFMNVKYFITSARTRLKRNLPVCFEDENNRVYLNTSYYPRAFMVYDYVVMRDDKAMLAYLKEVEPNLDKKVVLEEEPSLAIRGASAKAEKWSVSITKYEPHSVEIDVISPANGLLVLTDCHYPGWEAYVDGRHAKILRADYTFRAVEVPKGRHIVEFLYRPNSLRIGLIVSLIFLLSGLTLVIFLAKRR